MVDAVAAAFPRYIFAVVPDGRWDEMHSVEGVAGYIRNGDGTGPYPRHRGRRWVARAPDRHPSSCANAAAASPGEREVGAQLDCQRCQRRVVADLQRSERGRSDAETATFEVLTLWDGGALVTLT